MLPALATGQKYKEMRLGTQNFYTFDETKGKITFLRDEYKSSDPDTMFVSFYKLNKDDDELEKYQLMVKVIRKTNTIKFERSKSQKDKILSMKLKLTAKGDLTVKFSTKMRAYSIEFYNSTILDLYIKPAQNRDSLEVDENFNVSQVNFTWEAISFLDDMLYIKLNFTSPSEISPLLVQDDLVWNLKGKYEHLFISAPLNTPLEKEFKTVEIKIMPQIRDNLLS